MREPWSRAALAAGALALALSWAEVVRAADYYVSAARGKGKKGTKEEPVRDLGIIVPQLKPGDTVHIAAGVYYGRSESGADKIEVPVSVIGGYGDDFARRDPWGEHRTVLSGKNKSDNFDGGPRLFIGTRKHKGTGAIVVDGLIVDNGERNGFAKDEGLVLSRMFQPKTKSNAAPDSPGISIDAPGGFEVTVKNCAVLNCAPHHKTGAIKVHAGARCKVTITNNLVANSTGSGICCLAWSHGSEAPEFVVERNTVLFTWKYDPLSTDCGSALKLESGVRIAVRGNVFAFSDAFGVDNALKSKVTSLSENLFCASLLATYLEFSTKMKLEMIEEEAQQVDEATGNVKEQITVPVPEEWSKHYAARAIVDRKVAEASVEPLDNWQNDLRRMLGLPLQGGSLDVKSDVWLHRLPLDAGLKCGEKKYKEKYGCEKPAAS